MKLLRVIGTINPSYGGPVEGLKQSVLTLQKLGHSNTVVTLDEPTCLWQNSFPGQVHSLGPGFGNYRFTPNLIPWLAAHIKEFNAVIVEGIWQYQSFAVWWYCRRIKFPYFVFIHGALDPWFKYQYPFKHLKKQLYWFWAESKILSEARAVLFTSEEEKKLASESFELNQINGVVVNFGIQDPDGNPETQRRAFLDAFPILYHKRQILFLSRIHLKKGCDILIKAFAKIAKIDSSLILVMAGPDSDFWKPNLQKLAQELGIENQIIWTGLLLDNLKWGAFYAAEVFILPSHSENFGVAVAEALACSTPVLISNKVNIWQEIKNMNAGLVSPDTVEGTLQILQTWISLPQSEKSRMRKNARQCFLKNFEIMKNSRHLIENVQEMIY